MASRYTMRQPERGNSSNLPITSAEEIRHFVGPVADHAIVEILGVMPTAEDLEVAVTYAQGEGDVADREGHEFSGKSARIYEILMTDDVYQVDER
jgi:hypothetical protein